MQISTPEYKDEDTTHRQEKEFSYRKSRTAIKTGVAKKKKKKKRTREKEKGL